MKRYNVYYSKGRAIEEESPVGKYVKFEDITGPRVGWRQFAKYVDYTRQCAILRVSPLSYDEFNASGPI